MEVNNDIEWLWERRRVFLWGLRLGGRVMFDVVFNCNLGSVGIRRGVRLGEF